MKAQKAAGSHARKRCGAVIGAIAGAVTICSAAGLGQMIRAAEASDADVVAITVDTVIADADRRFTATVYLDELPDTGICAPDFAIAYDPAVLTIDNVELLYDTGADAAEALVDPTLAGTVFHYEDIGGELQVRWATALRDCDYWLRDEQAFFTVSGVFSEQAEFGSCGTLRIVPATRETYSGSGEINTVIAAGYLDGEGNSHNCETRLTDGAVWYALDETGATMYGDVNCDGRLTAEDASLLQQVIAEQITLGSAAAYANADCEFDGVLSIADVTLMLQVINGEQEAAVLGAH